MHLVSGIAIICLCVLLLLAIVGCRSDSPAWRGIDSGYDSLYSDNYFSRRRQLELPVWETGEKRSARIATFKQKEGCDDSGWASSEVAEAVDEGFVAACGGTADGDG
jgi:hypothetical protein